jgi:hypothetical protein
MPIDTFFCSEHCDTSHDDHINSPCFVSKKSPCAFTLSLYLSDHRSLLLSCSRGPQNPSSFGFEESWFLRGGAKSSGWSLPTHRPIPHPPQQTDYYWKAIWSMEQKPFLKCKYSTTHDFPCYLPPSLVPFFFLGHRFVDVRSFDHGPMGKQLQCMQHLYMLQPQMVIW